MDSIKVKNFIIIVLLIVDAILLSVFITDYVRENALEESAVEGAVALLGENGISVADDVDLSERQIEALSVSRDTEKEYKMADSLLNNVSTTDPGGNIMLYFGSVGEARFSGTGSVEVNLRAGAYSTTDPVASARRFASGLGMDTLREPVSNSVDPETMDGTLVLGCTINGVRVVNCNLSFTYGSGTLMAVYGTRVLDTVTQGSGRSTVDVPTVLMRFLELVLDGGHICSSLNELELGYNMRSNASGEGELIPVWRIATDTGEYYINAMTGLEETVPDAARKALLE